MARLLAFLFLWALPPSAFAKDTVVLFLGDSLTEGLGVPPEAAYPALIEKELKADKRAVKVLNGGISGSTSASGVSRLKWHLKAKEKPEVLVLALGANDGLRGLSVPELKKNLAAVVQLAKANQIRVLLAGMMMPPNYGKEYTDAYGQAFPAVAKDENVPLVPFLLEGVGGERAMNQPDGIHPNEAGHKLLAQNVLKYLKPLLAQK